MLKYRPTAIDIKNRTKKITKPQNYKGKFIYCFNYPPLCAKFVVYENITKNVIEGVYKISLYLCFPPSHNKMKIYKTIYIRIYSFY